MTFTLEDYICRLHTGSWYTWTDSSSKVYNNLALVPQVWNAGGTALIDNPHSLPSESACNAGVATLQTDWDAKDYSRLRKAKYNLLNQDEMRYDDVKNSTTTWVDAIDTIKAAHPKP